MKNSLSVCLLLFSMVSCGQKNKQEETTATEKPKNSNHLIHETSPYLLQHAHNPVNWYPWGEEALNKAKKENKLIIISIGYSACHWCHVMEHESFEDKVVAQYMNDNFIAIKIDREERPDIDQVYMNAVQLLTGSGGWPLNVVALPDGRPIYGGTYFPKKEWLSMLNQVSKFVTDTPDKAEQQAASLTAGIKSNAIVTAITPTSEFKPSDLDLVFSTWKKAIDTKNGGQDRAPKFPLPIGYQFLLHYNFLTGNKAALEAVNTTLTKMADGGIYDQIGGGFARYSTDAIWKAPHFEKMLYDNAQLVSLYSTAYQATKNPYYKIIVYETLEFIERELTSPEGAFYASLDADSESEEGKFYVWTKAELQTVFGNDTNIISDYYSVTNNGNWENGTNILYKTKATKTIADKYKITEIEVNQKIAIAKKILLKERAKRIRPALDDKVLTAWNALMLKGYVDAYRVFDEPKFLKVAQKNANFILEQVQKSDSRLDRNYKNGKSTINAFLDDYAFTIEAFIDLYQATFDEQWLQKAKQLNDYTLTHFYDKQSGMFYYTSNLDPSLIARKMELSDNVIPAANSQMAKNLYMLGQYFYNEDYIAKAKTMLHNVKQEALNSGTFYANWDILMAWFAKEPYEIAIVGDEYLAKRKEFDNYYLPNVFLSGGKNEGTLTLLKDKLVERQTTIYACQNKHCKRPETEVKNVLQEIK